MEEDSKEEVSIVIKLLIDTKANRVLFAEAGKDFVDFLFHILSLPIGSVVKLLTTEGMVGSVGDLCNSIESLNTQYLQPHVTKNSILEPKPTSSNGVRAPLLMHTTSKCNPPASNTPKTFYACPKTINRACSGGFGGTFGIEPCNTIYVSDGEGACCPVCHGPMSKPLNYFVPPKLSTTTATTLSESSDGEGYVKGVVTYMVMDNLEVKPMSTISGLTLINKFNVKDVASLVEKEVQVGLPQGVALVKASLQTKTVLTTVFL